MTTIDASALTTPFSIFGGQVNPASFPIVPNAPAGSYGWIAAGLLRRVDLFSAAGDLNGATFTGTVNAVSISFRANPFLTFVPEITITGLNIPLSALVDTATPSNTDAKFWNAVLAGPTTIIAPSASWGEFYGDAFAIETGTIASGAKDVFLGSNALDASSIYVGEAGLVDTGGTLIGGNDIFSNLLGSIFIGDAVNSAGTLKGGDDVFSGSESGTVNPSQHISLISGDAQLSSGNLVGGNDNLSYVNIDAISSLIGDVAGLVGQASLVGGADTIFLDRVASLASFGFGASGIITGDVVTTGDGNAVGGNDKITVRNTDVANALTGDGVDVAGDFKGGSDTIVFECTFAGSLVSASTVSGDIRDYTSTLARTLIGGNDVLALTSASTTFVVGDARLFDDFAGTLRGGNDTISWKTIGNNSVQVVGDSVNAKVNQFQGGNDSIALEYGSGFAEVSGDADSLISNANFNYIMGNDTISIGDGAGPAGVYNLYGDVRQLDANGVGTITFGSDVLIGGSHADVLIGDFSVSVGSGTFTALGGNDTLDGRGGDDTLLGGIGIDTAIFSLNQSVHVDLAGIASSNPDGTDPSGDFEAIGQGYDHFIGIENVTGSGLDDAIAGDANVNVLNGAAGSDLLVGRAGNDTLIGGLGKDTLTGGLDADRFDFNSKIESGKTASTRDVIADFQHNIDDIDLKTIDASSKKAGNQAFKFIGTQAFHKVAGELHVRAEPGHKVVEGDINGDGKADFQIEVTGSITLTAGDFIL